MSIDYEKLKGQPRLLLEAQLKPLQGDRFQPTGFADLGPARYSLPDGTEMLLLESAQSVANRMELACWNEESDDLIEELKGLPYIRIDCGDLGKTNTIKEFHRLNSPYIWTGDGDDAMKRFRQNFLDDLGVKTARKKKAKQSSDADNEGTTEVPGVLDFQKLYKTAFKWDTNSVLHGLFLEKVAGRLRMTRALSGFIEARKVASVDSGGAKVDHVLPSPKHLGLSADDGFGNVPFHRTEFTADEIKAYFNLDLALLRGYGLGDEATRLLIALALFKIRRFLSTGLRLRTACDLEVVGDVSVARPAGLIVPDEQALLQECQTLIGKCRAQFAGITEVVWRPSEKKTKSKKATVPEVEEDEA